MPDPAEAGLGRGRVCTSMLAQYRTTDRVPRTSRITAHLVQTFVRPLVQWCACFHPRLAGQLGAIHTLSLLRSCCFHTVLLVLALYTPLPHQLRCSSLSSFSLPQKNKTTSPPADPVAYVTLVLHVCSTMSPCRGFSSQRRPRPPLQSFFVAATEWFGNATGKTVAPTVAAPW